MASEGKTEGAGHGGGGDAEVATLIAHRTEVLFLILGQCLQKKIIKEADIPGFCMAIKVIQKAAEEREESDFWKTHWSLQLESLSSQALTVWLNPNKPSIMSDFVIYLHSRINDYLGYFDLPEENRVSTPLSPKAPEAAEVLDASGGGGGGGSSVAAGVAGVITNLARRASDATAALVARRSSAVARDGDVARPQQFALAIGPSSHLKLAAPNSSVDAWHEVRDKINKKMRKCSDDKDVDKNISALYTFFLVQKGVIRKTPAEISEFGDGFIATLEGRADLTTKIILDDFKSAAEGFFAPVKANAAAAASPALALGAGF